MAPNGRVGIDRHGVAHVGMALADFHDLPVLVFRKAARTGRHAVVELHAVADAAGVADDEAGAVR